MRRFASALVGLAAAAVVTAGIPAWAAGPWPTPVTSPLEARQESMRLFATGTDRFDPGLVFGSSVTGTTTVLADAGRDGSLYGKAVVAVSTNNGGTCAIDSTGDVSCWGNAEGFDRFGLGDDVDSREPVAIPITVGEVERPVTNVAVSDYETCVTTWLKAVCWGSAPYMHPVATSPTVVPGAPDVVDIDADAGKVCGIATDATLWCWGTRASELGVNKTDGRVDPTQLAGSLAGRQVLAVSVGEDVSCAVDTLGAVHCWGVGSAGVGTGQTGDVLEPVLVRGSLEGERVVGISVGPAVFAIDSRGRLHRWSGSGVPALATDLGAMAGKRVLQVSADSRRDAAHVCAVVLGGDVYCRGFNAYGRLGIGGRPDMYGETDNFTKMLAGSARGMKAVEAVVGAEYTFVVSGTPLLAPLRAVSSGALVMRLDVFAKALGTGSVGAQKPASANGTTVSMPIEGTSGNQMGLSGTLTLKTTDGAERVLSAGMLNLKSGAVSFIVQGVGWPYDGNRITLFTIDVKGKVSSKTKGRVTTTTLRSAPAVMADVKNSPGEIFFPGDIWFPGEIFFPGEIWNPGAPVGTFSGTWKAQRK